MGFSCRVRSRLSPSSRLAQTKRKFYRLTAFDRSVWGDDRTTQVEVEYSVISRSGASHMMVNGGNIKKGSYILFKHDPHLVTLTEFVSPGKGSAFMRTKLKSVKTGNVVEFTFKSIEMVEEADVSSVEMQYLYQDGEDYVFMNPRSYEQVTVPGFLMKDYLPFLLPEQIMYVMLYDDDPIGVRFPGKVALKVVYSEDTVAGGRINAPKKKVKLETGYEIDVPLFIKEGESIIVDTDTGLYVSRGE